MIRSLICKEFSKVFRASNTVARITFADGSTHQIGVGDPEVNVVFRTRMAEWGLVCSGPYQLMEDYFARNVDIVGKDAFLRLAEAGLTTDAFGNSTQHPVMAIRLWFLERRQNNRDVLRAKCNAAHHYAIDWRFFRHVLGETLGYSEGRWLPDEALTRGNLDTAKHRNYDHICRQLLMKEGDRVLEVGSAWGYMALLAAGKYGAQVTNIGLVKAQNDVLRDRMKDYGLVGRITTIETDQSHLLSFPGGYFDKYVEIGVYEHRGWDKHCREVWLDGIVHALRPGGIGFISTSYKVAPKPTNYCIVKHVFPGGYIPSLTETLNMMEAKGLKIIAVEDRTEDYEKTLWMWYKNMGERWEEIQKLDPEFFTESFRRIWQDFYFGGVATAFRARRLCKNETLGLVHITFANQRADEYPTDRSFLAFPDTSIPDRTFYLK